MRFNSQGTLLLGGRSRIIINGVTPGRLRNFNAGNWDFTTDYTVAGQGETGGAWYIHEYDISADDLYLLDDRACSEFYASASGRWVALRSTTPPTSFDPTNSWHDRVAVGMSVLQDELFRPYPSYRGLIVRTVGGAQLDVAPGAEVTSCSMGRDGVVVYTTPGDVINAVGIDTPLTPASGCGGSVFVTLGDGRRFMVGYVPEVGGMALFPLTTVRPLMGYLLSVIGDFNPAIAQRDDGIVVVGTGVDQSESRSRLYEVNLATGRFRVTLQPGSPGPWTTLTEVYLTDAPVILPKLPNLAHPVSVAVYKDLDNQSGCDSEVLVNFQRQATARPCWSTEECLPWRKGPLLGIYTEARPGDSGMAALPTAEMLGTRILRVWDGEGPPELSPKSRYWDVDGVECYLPNIRGSETLAQSFTRWARNLSWVLTNNAGRLVSLVLMYYRKGGTGSAGLYSVQEVVDAIGAAVPLLNTSARVVLANPFAFDRGNGIVAYPEFREMLRRLVLVTPGTATFRPVNPQPPVNHSTGGAIMQSLIQGVIQHLGINKYDNLVTFTADSSGRVWSVQPDGSLDTRPKGDHGSYESAVLDGQIASFRPVPGKTYSFVVASVAGL